MFASLKFLNHTATRSIERSKIALFMTIFLFGSVVSQAQTVTNGSLTSITGNSITPPGWNNVNGYNPGSGIGSWPSVDALDVAFSAWFGSSTVTPAPSPNGGTWAGISSIPPNFENEAIEQVVPGFTIGTTYRLSFYVANFGGSPFDDPGVVTGYINGTAVAVSPTLNLVPNIWTYVSGTFIASADSMTVQLDAIHNTGDSGAGGYYSVDGIEIIPLSPCLAENNAPTLSATSVCLITPTYDLTGITASNTPASTSLTWHSGAPATNGNTLAGTNAIAVGNYYAAFYDTVNDCYGPTTAFNVYPVPVAAFTAPTVCSNSLSSFTDQSTIASGNIVDWNWNFDDGSNSALQNPTHQYAASSDYNVTLTITSDLGCTNSITQSVTTNEPPVAAFSAQAGCDNNPVAFTDQSTIGSGTIVDWSWNFGDGNSSGLQNLTHQYASASNYNVTLTVTSNLGCTNSITIQVLTTATSAPTITASGATTFCAGGSVTLTSSNGSTYLWSNGETTASIDVVTDGNYTVIITNADGCTSPASATTTVAVDQLPDLTVTEVNNTITATQTGAAYQWIDCGNGNQEIAGATSIAFTPTVNGSYAVIVTSGTCSDTSACTVISTIGLNEQELVEIGVHPNPGFDVVEVTSTSEIQHFEMYATTGELIRLVQETTFDISNLASGIYFLKVTTNQGTGMVRLVKE
jgi:PKD repeat protein